MRRALLLLGLGVLAAVGAATFFLLPAQAAPPGISTREAGAAFLGLVVLVIAVLGPDWRDWF